MSSRRRRKFWTPAELELLRKRYPHEATAVVALACGHPISSAYQTAARLGLRKTSEYLASPAACRLRRGDNVGSASRFMSGHAPANKGLRRPGWAPGRMAETQFKPGCVSKRWDPQIYCVGAMRITTDGTLQIRLTPEPHPPGWVSLARYTWKLHTGRWPRADYIVRARDGDPHNTLFENLEAISRQENMRRNTIHNLPVPLKLTIVALGQLKRRIRERSESRARPC